MTMVIHLIIVINDGETAVQWTPGSSAHRPLPQRRSGFQRIAQQIGAQLFRDYVPHLAGGAVDGPCHNLVQQGVRANRDLQGLFQQEVRA